MINNCFKYDIKINHVKDKDLFKFILNQNSHNYACNTHFGLSQFSIENSVLKECFINPGKNQGALSLNDL